MQSIGAYAESIRIRHSEAARVFHKKEQKMESQPKTMSAPAAPAPGKVINKDVKKDLQKFQKLFQQLEEKIAMLNTQKSEFEVALTTPDVYSNKQKFTETENLYRKATDEHKWPGIL